MDVIKPEPQENPEEATEVLSLQETPQAEGDHEDGDDVLAHGSTVSLAACASQN